VPSDPDVVASPTSDLWRVARGDDPLAVPVAGRVVGSGGANRFDPLTMEFGVLYFGSSLEVCFGETLARFRPSLALIALVEEEWDELGFMAVGTVAADWRYRRTAVHIQLPENLLFLDAESAVTHQFLRKELALGLSSLGLTDLDVPMMRGPDRRVTQMISEWAYMSRAEDGGPRYAGIRYESRIRTGWECWAFFDDEEIELEVIERVPITLDMPDLQQVAKLFELKMF
jgi:hypothetical protein